MGEPMRRAEWALVATGLLCFGLAALGPVASRLLSWLKPGR
jgi:hypothetical protein